MTSPARNERGLALITVLIVAAALIGLASAALIFSRSDAMVSSNARDGAKALWIAMAGVEAGKDWLEKSDFRTALPHTITASFPGATPAEGRYTVFIDRYPFPPGSDKFQIVATGTAPDRTRRTVEEIIDIVGATQPLDAISIEGTGTHVKLADPANGPGAGIPFSTIDARNHDRHGNPGDPRCPTVSAIAGTPVNQNTAQQEIDGLKCYIAARADQNCRNNGAQCTPALRWVHAQGFSEPFTPPTCDPALPTCCRRLDLSAPQLRGQSVVSQSPVVVDTPRASMYLGPFVLDTPLDGTDAPLTRVYTTAEHLALQQIIERLLDFAATASPRDLRCIPGNIDDGQTHRFESSWENPKIVVASAPNHSDARIRQLSNGYPCNGQVSGGANLVIRNGSVVEGTGLLIVPREIILEDATVHWRGIVLVLGDGDFRIKRTGNNLQPTCGMVLGGVVLQDSSGRDPKLNLVKAGDPSCPNPFTNQPPENPVSTNWSFAVKYSCESIDRTLSAFPRTLAWLEQYPER